MESERVHEPIRFTSLTIRPSVPTSTYAILSLSLALTHSSGLFFFLVLCKCTRAFTGVLGHLHRIVKCRNCQCAKNGPYTHRYPNFITRS